MIPVGVGLVKSINVVIIRIKLFPIFDMMNEMDSLKEQKEIVQLTKEQRLQSVLDLSKKFGGSAEIPEEELTAIGYVRKTQEDGTVRLLPYERVVELSQKDPQWEKSLKEKVQPFGRIAIDLPTVERPCRFIPRTQNKLLANKLEAVECAFYPNWNEGSSIVGSFEDIDPRLQNLHIFSLDFLAYLSKKSIGGKTIDEETANLIIFEALPMRIRNEELDPDDPNDFQGKHFRLIYQELDGSVTSENSKRMYNELTRLSGYFTDITELTNDFLSRLNAPFYIVGDVPGNREAQLRKDLSEGKKPNVDQQWLEQMQLHREVQKYLKSVGVQTWADAIRYIFPQYLEHVGLPEIAEVISKSDNLSEIAKTLENTPISNSSQAEEKELRQTLKTATPEERMVLSKQIKELENIKKKKRQIRQGVIDYFAAPQVFVEVCKRKVKEAQDFLIAGKDDKGQATFYLDANPNKNLDKNPGLVSGDCTIDRPLPFDKSDITAYNVKVFAENDQHVGNIYLLATTAVSETGERKKIWHFDAIQVPKSEINWKQGIGIIVSTLAKQAEAKGVDAITTNSEVHKISNYDYIAYAVNEYWEIHGRQMVDITMPQVDETSYSSFQGNGTDIVLWSKEKLSEAYERELEVNPELFEIQNNQQ
ncbi:MAG: hypothetical protein V1808_03670 [Candidatus Daviesbacteria bacterium]